MKKKLDALINSKRHLLEELTKQKEIHDLFVEDTEIHLQHVNKEHTCLECSVSFWKMLRGRLTKVPSRKMMLINDGSVIAVCTTAATRKLISNQTN